MIFVSEADYQILYRWLVGCFGVNGPLETVFLSLLGRLPERGRRGRGKTEENRMSKQSPPAPM